MKWISKDAVMGELDTLLGIVDGDPVETRIINMIASILNRLPAHEFDLSQEAKGEWTQESNTDEMLNIWHCSNCKEEFCSEIGGNPLEWNYNFCPNCGADMRGNKDEDPNK